MLKQVLSLTAVAQLALATASSQSAAFAAEPAQPAAGYTGSVYVDQNGNGSRDGDEKVMPGVVVTDGQNVIRTDAAGKFALPGHKTAQFIYLTMPSGFKMPKFYQCIDPQTSAYDFGLIPDPHAVGKDGKHHFIHTSDTEIFKPKQDNQGWSNTLKKYCADTNAAFLIHTGDICYEKGLREHIKLLNTAEGPCSMYYSLGNHDLVGGFKTKEGLFESLYGPCWFSFDIGNVHYVALPHPGGSYNDAFIGTWLAQDLAMVPKTKPLIVFRHDLLSCSDKFVYGKVNLNEHNLKAWFYGHWHFNQIRKQGNVLTVCTGPVQMGGIDNSTAMIRDVQVDAAGDITFKSHYVLPDKAVQVAGVTPSATGVDVSVNAHNGASVTRGVSCQVQAGDRRIGPVELKANTNWNWTGSLPLDGVGAGKEVVLSVTADFGGGVKQTASHTFVYTGKAEGEPVVVDKDWNNLLETAAHVGNAPAMDPDLGLAWVANVGDNIFMTSPIISGGRVVIASTDEDFSGKAHVYGFDAKTGKLAWKFKSANSIKNTIAADDGIVFAQNILGDLYALSAADGKLLWQAKIPVPGVPGLFEGLIADKGIVHAGTGRGLAAYEAKTGKCLWQNAGWSQHDGCSTTLALGNGVLIGGANWDALYGNDATTGKLLWSARKNDLRFRGGAAAIHGDMFYIISGNYFSEMETQSGKPLRSKKLPFTMKTISVPLVTDTAIIFGTDTEGLVALDRNTLEILWKCAIEPALVLNAPYSTQGSRCVSTSPVLVGKVVYFAASDGTFRGVDQETGKVVWSFKTGAPSFSTIAVSGNTLFAADFSGNVYAFTRKICK